ncbi:hypothetical protein HDV00_007172 [Rhizophlyctis rosea]|nr:hypothetical protein HDV00_007172 [Rhizophlyctis rosea]
MRTATIFAALAVTTATASSIPFLDNKDFGIVTFDHKYHTPIRDGSTIPVKCGTFTAGLRDDSRFSMGPESPYDLKNPRAGSLLVRKTDTDICFSTNSTVPCIVRAVTVSNSTWGQILNSFPGGTSDFENCYQKGSIALVRGSEACLDLRLFTLQFGDDGKCGMRMGFVGRGDGSTLGWRCDQVGGDGDPSAVMEQM